MASNEAGDAAAAAAAACVLADVQVVHLLDALGTSGNSAVSLIAMSPSDLTAVAAEVFGDDYSSADLDALVACGMPPASRASANSHFSAVGCSQPPLCPPSLGFVVGPTSGGMLLPPLLYRAPPYRLTVARRRRPSLQLPTLLSRLRLPSRSVVTAPAPRRPYLLGNRGTKTWRKNGNRCWGCAGPPSTSSAMIPPDSNTFT